MGWVLLFILSRIYQTPLLLSAYKAFKYIIRVSTSTSELYRLCNSTIATSRQLEYEGTDEKEHLVTDTASIAVPKDIVYRIDKSIFYSKQLVQEKLQLIENDCQLNNVLEAIVTKKQFPRHSMDTPAAHVLAKSLDRIHQSNVLLNTVEGLVKTKYDATNDLHEEKLLKLWSEMMPDTELESRITKQWVEIGFQGNDPATDFRGMGIQGLNDLLYFIQTHADHALCCLQHASHPVYWYPYAIVGINITKFAYQTLESKKLQLYLFQYGTDVATFQEFYCYLFYKFNQLWITHQPQLTVMEFEVKFQEFKMQIEKELVQEKIMPLSKLLEQLEQEKLIAAEQKSAGKKVD
ncbi:Cleavage stimulation factor 50 kDa subunit [Mucor velutinosus]|uniref:Cleavage stimulation factor 50 kDa subunit n=1 Tax=Mucor velutinosus TaxID=708070 RepID=A0AAN7DSZ0_9FUNG|nr:Cleavage stimulation factor 50 kDa subunit [Mucor velutinosus]